jgi:hypothetical protein
VESEGEREIALKAFRLAMGPSGIAPASIGEPRRPPTLQRSLPTAGPRPLLVVLARVHHGEQRERTGTDDLGPGGRRLVAPDDGGCTLSRCQSVHDHRNRERHVERLTLAQPISGSSPLSPANPDSMRSNRGRPPQRRSGFVDACGYLRPLTGISLGGMHDGRQASCPPKDPQLRPTAMRALWTNTRRPEWSASSA